MEGSKIVRTMLEADARCAHAVLLSRIEDLELKLSRARKKLEETDPTGGSEPPVGSDGLIRESMQIDALCARLHAAMNALRMLRAVDESE